MPLKYNFKMTDNDIDNAIVSLGKRTKSVRLAIHQVAVSTLAAWSESGDISTAVRRATAIVKDIDARYAQSLVNWFTAFTPLEWHVADKENDVEAGFHYHKDFTTISMDAVVEAKAKPWDTYTKVNAPVAFVLMEEVEKLLARVATRSKKPNEIDVIPEDLRVALVNAVSAHKQEQEV